VAEGRGIFKNPQSSHGIFRGQPAPLLKEHNEFYFIKILIMSKTIHYSDDARKLMFQGMEMVADAVKVTM
jgi:hypothetical protein